MSKTTVGYTAGQDTAPTYNSVCSGRTGHTEAVQVHPSSAHLWLALGAISACADVALVCVCYAGMVSSSEL